MIGLLDVGFRSLNPTYGLNDVGAGFRRSSQPTRVVLRKRLKELAPRAGLEPATQ